MLSLSSFIILQVTVCLAQVVPTAPGPGRVFTAGESCPMEWDPDATGAWKSLTINLMSGSNDNMSLVANVVSGLDGTLISSYNWTCPKVDPYSAIYFYQFSQNAQDVTVSSTWTTRFAITSANGTSTLPDHLTQPNGEGTPWGVGYLISTDASDAMRPTLSSLIPTSVVDIDFPTMSPSAAPRSTASPPEVTLNVPPPRPNKHIPRSNFSTAYVREVPGSLPHRATSSSPARKGRHRRERRRL